MIKLIITIVFIVASLVGGLYVVHPSYQKYQRQVKENEVLYEELENIMVYVNELKEIKKKIGENEESFQKIENALPEDHDAPSFFLYLQEKIEENGLTSSGNLGSFRVNSYNHNNTDHGRIKEIVFELTLSGEYEDIKKFFRETEKLMRVITINNMNISSGGGPGNPFFDESVDGDEGVSVNFSAKTYSY
jgi:Tfp pilus assembly protein PilO